MTAPRFHCGAVVTDIEGTTGSVAFVHDVLFPYARERIDIFLRAKRDDALVTQALRDAAALAGEPDASDDRIAAILRAWIDEDRKATPLKTLQGYIWAEGYAQGVLRGHVYADAAAGLRRWHAAGLPLYVYSSGSIAAQKLLFEHSTAGDLTPLFRGYFDTMIGAKIEADAYRRISAEIAMTPADILFLSDRDVELEAAHAAGWQVALVAREQDDGAALTGAAKIAPVHVAFPMFRSFDEITVARRLERV